MQLNLAFCWSTPGSGQPWFGLSPLAALSQYIGACTWLDQYRTEQDQPVAIVLF